MDKTIITIWSQLEDIHENISIKLKRKTLHNKEIQCININNNNIQKYLSICIDGDIENILNYTHIHSFVYDMIMMYGNGFFEEFTVEQQIEVNKKKRHHIDRINNSCKKMKL